MNFPTDKIIKQITEKPVLPQIITCFFITTLIVASLVIPAEAGRKQYTKKSANQRKSTSKSLQAAKNLNMTTEVANGRKISIRLKSEQMKNVQAIISLLRGGKTNKALDRWKIFLKKHISRMSLKKQNQIADQIARHIIWYSYLAPKPTLAESIEKNLFYLNQEKALSRKHARLTKMRRSSEFNPPNQQVSQKQYDTDTAGSDGKSISVTSGGNSTVNSELSNEIKQLENEMETVRNKRSEYQTMFENFDQKANQLFNILSTVLKSMKEMKSATIRNIN